MKFKPLIFGTLALLALIIVAGGVYYFTSPSGETRPFVEKYFSALCENNIDKAVTYMMFAGRYEAKVLTSMENDSKICSDNGGFSKVKYTSEEIQGNKAKIKGKVIYGNGTYTPIDKQLIRVDEEWKIILQ